MWENSQWSHLNEEWFSILQQLPAANSCALGMRPGGHWPHLCWIISRAKMDEKLNGDKTHRKKNTSSLEICFQRPLSQSPPRGSHSLEKFLELSISQVTSCWYKYNIGDCYHQPFSTFCLRSLDFLLGICAEILGPNKLGKAGCWEREVECLWEGWWSWKARVLITSVTS